MIGTNIPQQFIELFDGRKFAVISDNVDEQTVDAIPVHKLYEDGSYDAESISTNEFSYNIILSKCND